MKDYGEYLTAANGWQEEMKAAQMAMLTAVKALRVHGDADRYDREFMAAHYRYGEASQKMATAFMESAQESSSLANVATALAYTFQSLGDALADANNQAHREFDPEDYQ